MGDGGTRGCLFVNAVTALAPGDAERVAFAQAHTRRVSAPMAATLSRGGIEPSQSGMRSRRSGNN